ncbi:putative Ntn-hydrolase superfamily protein [Rhizobium borbori]|uniref:Putative Ntn-hydrolase superfamily protein n=2 Tax=Allorhizobium borbori TaxID=485907 RepID=A0A7W6K684_9HYPH|nr:putative Ntn-hydrolase superfamily protein [Allorhizobium borbori]
MFGMAMGSSGVAAGNRCPWVRAGVGGIATQHRTDTRAGPLGLDLLSKGCSANETVRILAESNDFPGERQFAAVDVHGRVAFYSGPEINNINGGYTGDQCVATGNFIANEGVPKAMVEAYEAAKGLGFAERLLAGVDAGLAAGGETKAIGAASLTIADKEAWPLVDLRVDWQDSPLTELRRLWVFFKPFQQVFVDQVIHPETMEKPVGAPMNI